MNTDVSAAYAPGYLLFLRDRTLMSQGFDADRGERRADPTPIAEEVDRLGQGARFANFPSRKQACWFTGAGAAKPPNSFGLTGRANNSEQPGHRLTTPSRGFHLTKNGSCSVVSRQQSGNADIWIMELARGTLTRFTFDPVRDLSPIWSPDGSRIIFALHRDGTPNLYLKAASGAGNDEPLLKSDHRKIPFDWSADGKFILYQELNPKTGFDLWVLPLSGEERPFPFLQTQFDERQGRFSPDGKWIAYTSNESGTWQVYVNRSFTFSGGKWQVSTNGGAQPQWRRDGKEIFYLSPDRKLMTVDVQGNGPTFEAGVPKAMFELRIQSVGLPGPRNFYVAAGDGQRFLSSPHSSSGSRLRRRPL